MIENNPSCKSETDYFVAKEGVVTQSKSEHNCHMMEKQEMQEEDGLSTTKEAAGKSQGNRHKSQRRMAADPVL